jgi:hypothetical protein
MIRTAVIFILILHCSCNRIHEWRTGRQNALWERRIAEVAVARSQYVIMNGLVGYIYRSEEVNWKVAEDEKYKIALSLADVLEAERCLREQMKTVDTNQRQSVPRVHQKLGIYTRQYVGYVDTRGETIVWVNAFCDDTPPHSGIRFVHDGGDCYWQVRVNLTRRKIYDLSINGEA